MSRRSTLAPLLPRADSPAIEQRLRPFRDQRVIESLDVHVVDQLGALVGEHDPDVALALALAVRAPRFGHICIDLGSLRVEHLAAEPDDDTPDAMAGLRLPDDRPAWIDRVARSPLVRGRETASRPFVLDRTLLYTDRYFGYQQLLAGHLGRRATEVMEVTDPKLLQQGLGALFGDGGKTGAVHRQQLGAAMAVLRGFTVISGGPGTGKTYTVRSVLTLLWAQWALDHDPNGDQPGPLVALAAPTGKAAARMAEAIQVGLEEYLELCAGALPQGRTVAQLKAFLTSLHPSTIHRLLGYRPASPTRFRHCAEDPAPFDAVVVDEASMVDLALMAKLVDAVRVDARLMLLGDQHQLASVEAGTVLADLCGPTSMSRLRVSSGFAQQLQVLAGLDGIADSAEVTRAGGPHDAIVQLDKNRRFQDESGIGQFARACLADDFDADRAVALLTSPDRFSDVSLIGHGDRSTLRKATQAAIVAGYRPYLERLFAGPRDGETPEQQHRDVLRELDGFRVLCAHRRGRLGVAGMNPACIELLEAARAESACGALRGFKPQGEFWVGRPILVVANDYVVKLFNGDIGVVVVDALGERKIAFPDPSGVRYVAPSRLPEHQTVFAMTIHKSQGSEFAHAMVVLPSHDSPILTRELIYTGVTRARDRMTLVGEPLVLADALNKTVRRASGLQAELWGSSG